MGGERPCHYMAMAQNIPSLPIIRSFSFQILSIQISLSSLLVSYQSIFIFLCVGACHLKWTHFELFHNCIACGDLLPIQSYCFSSPASSPPPPPPPSPPSSSLSTFHSPPDCPLHQNSPPPRVCPNLPKEEVGTWQFVLNTSESIECKSTST